MPPELEQVDPEQLKKEQENLTEDQKNDRAIYETMKEAKKIESKTESKDDQSEEEFSGCTVEEVIEPEQVKVEVEPV